MQSSSIPFPGELTTMDGSEAVVWIEINACSGASSYPITPSSNMGAGFQQAVADGKANVWGEKLMFLEPESEHSAATVCEGYAAAGGRVTNFTSGQGLILMKEVLYTIAGKRLPVVFNIGARALTFHALNVHAGHDDIMGVADCGWGILFARNAQEAGDLCLISRRVAEDSYTPFFNVQDGFLTTHTVEDVRRPEIELIKSFLRPPDEALVNLVDPSHPVMSGVVQNQDAYMRGKIAGRAFYQPIKENLRKVFSEFTKLTGRKYDFIDTFQMEDAEYAIVGMGSYMETARATARALREKKGIKIGVVNITSFRPFPGPELVNALKGVKGISVLERMDDSNAPENPLTRELKAAFADALWGHPDFIKISEMPLIQHGAGGLGSYDVRVRDMQAIVENLQKGKHGKLRYCLGIDHPDTLLCSDPEIDLRGNGSFAMRGYSIGGFGSIATNRVIASVCSELFNMSVQAYPKYGAEKKGMPTMYFMAAGLSHIETHQELKDVDFVAINDVNVFLRGNPLDGLSPAGGIFLQTNHALAEDIWAELPEKYKEIVRANGYRLFGLDAMSIARSVARSTELINRMQGIVLLGVFLRVTPLARIRGLNEDDLLGGMEKILTKTFGKRGSKAIEDNMTCIRRGFHEVISVAPMYQESMQDAWR